jgi:hypothetical protein
MGTGGRSYVGGCFRFIFFFPHEHRMHLATYLAIRSLMGHCCLPSVRTVWCKQSTPAISALVISQIYDGNQHGSALCVHLYSERGRLGFLSKDNAVVPLTTAADGSLNICALGNKQHSCRNMLMVYFIF